MQDVHTRNPIKEFKEIIAKNLTENWAMINDKA